MHFISKCEEDTIDFASKIASKLNKSDIIILTGELGSGKTKFVQGILKYFGLENQISSPTFTILNEYYSDKINIYHFDVYRLADIDEFYAIGGEEYFGKGICLIEWGEMIEKILPTDYIKVTFKKNEENEEYRELEIEAFGEKDLNIFKKIWWKENMLA